MVPTLPFSQTDNKTFLSDLIKKHQQNVYLKKLTHVSVGLSPAVTGRVVHQGAIIAMTKAMAVDESSHQVRVNW